MPGRSARRLGVAVIPTWYPSPERPLDGIFVRDHTHAAARENDVAVLVSDMPARGQRKLFTLDDGVEDGLRTFRIRYPRSSVPQLATAGYLLGILSALRRLRREGRPVDLLHAHVHRAAWTAMIIGAVTRLPVVVSEHSSEFAAARMSRGVLLRARASFRAARLVCPVSDYLRGRIEAHGIRARFRVVPNAVDTELFAPAPERRPGPVRIIAVAALQPSKGLTYLFEALRRLSTERRDVVLHVVGDGPCRQEYEALVCRDGLAGNVVFHGQRPRPAVASLMRAADFLVLPSLGETFSVAVVEAMASGLPVVASRVGGVPELVDDRSGVLVEPGDADALCDALVHMVDRHRDYRREAIRERAVARWSRDSVGYTWTDVYRGVLAER
jgi:glycosyltransferase involved in cell wall biosynthesis